MTDLTPLWLVFAATIYPGLLFITAVALLSEWWVRKLVARAQKRMGPSYVGPAGILQPFADFIKLIMAKEEIKQKYSSLGIAKAFAFLGIGAIIAVLLMLPLSPVRIVGSYDIIALSYFCCVWVPVAMIVMGLSTPNPFTNAGVSRLLSIYALCEPAYFMAILTPAALVTKFYGIQQPYSVFWTSLNSGKLWANPYSAGVMAIALIAVTVSTQAKAMAQPFNIPEAEQEIIAGPMTEFSGPLLALNNLLHDLDTAVTLFITDYLLLGGPYPYQPWSLGGIALVGLKYVALLTLLAIIKAAYGRFKIEQGVSVIAKYALIPSLIAITLAMI